MKRGALQYDTNSGSYVDNAGMLVKSTSSGAVNEYGRYYTASAEVLYQATTVGSVQHAQTNVNVVDGLTAYISYLSTPVLNVGTSGTGNWKYNSSNRLLSVPGYITSILYEPDGQTRQITYANGVVTSFTYDLKRNWLTRVRSVKDAAILQDYIYTRNLAGQITAINGVSNDDDWTYTYDFRGQLLTATNGGSLTDEVFTYALNGNMKTSTRVSGTYTYPAASEAHPHSPNSVGSRVFTYDTNGNMTNDGLRSYVWNASNRLESVTRDGSTVSFAYSASGARVKKETSAGAAVLYPNSGVEIDYVAPGGAEVIRYPHPDIKIIQKLDTGATEVQYLHRDHLASVRLVTDAAGAVVEQTGYQAYGDATNPSVQTAKNYIGERRDVETGLMYLNARYYDPTLGRFIPADPETRH